MPTRHAQPHATVKRLADGRTIVRMRGPGGLELVAVAPSKYLTVAGDDAIPLVEEIAGLWDNIAKGFSKVIKNKWVKTAAAAVLSAYGVPPGVTTKAMEASGNLVDLARGDPRAAERLRRIAVSAAGGNPAAQTARAAVVHAARAQRHATAAQTAVLAAVEGDAAARRRLELIAHRAAAEPQNEKAQASARAVRAVVQAMRSGPPPARRASSAPPPPPARRFAASAPATIPSGTVLRDEEGRSYRVAGR